MEPTPSSADVAPDPLEPAIRAADRGDVALARRLARSLAEGPDAAHAARARALLEQFRPDPAVLAVMIATGLLTLALVAMYFTRA